MIIRHSSITDRNPVFGWEQVANVNNVTATNASIDWPARNLANASTHLKWRSNTGVTNDYLTVDGFNETISYLAIAAHNFGTEGITCSVECFYSAAWNVVVPATAINDNTPLLFQFVPVVCTGVRLRMQGGGVSILEAAVLYAGEITTFEKSIRIDVNHGIYITQEASQVVNGTSESGQFVGRLVKNLFAETKVDFSYITPEFFADQVFEFLHNSIAKPFFMAVFPFDFSVDVGFCWLTKDPKPEFHPPTARFNLSLEVRGLGLGPEI